MRDKNGDFDYFISANISNNATILEKWNEFLGRGWVFLDMPYHFLYTYEIWGSLKQADVYNATPQGASPGDILRKDLNGDGRIDGNDRKAYPHIQRDRPTANFSLNAGMSWKGLDLSVCYMELPAAKITGLISIIIQILGANDTHLHGIIGINLGR